MPERSAVLLLALAAACSPKVIVQSPTAVPQPMPRPAVSVPPPPPERAPVLQPSEAYRRGLMPLASTGVVAWRQAKPQADGRGVLIAILDSGIDAGVPGLGTTSTGERKLLDLRDFSGEGRIRLEPIDPQGDSVVVGGVRLGGFRRVAALDPRGPYFGGLVRERPLGELPASDLNGNGTDADSLPLVVAKATDGWVVFADTDGDGSLENERPVHDYLVARETFGWHAGGRPSPLTVAVNFSGDRAPPVLDLFFDTSGHGTHVTGIAAGSGLYGVSGFDGVAPGALVLGVKIANNAYGGVTVTGSMLRGIEYAIRFAKTRNLPLVLNLSFGVGNEREGTARIDAAIDSVLAANPNVVFVTSAGNDGPGLSTVGFPATANRVLTVGATYPSSFLPPRPLALAGDVLAFFSARGGEAAKPDVLAPGLAYSSVPRWNTGEEDKSGTSMASPHAAGAAALLLSAAQQEQRAVTGEQVKHALIASARPVRGATPIDEGGGLVDVVAADRVLRTLPAIALIRTRAAGPGAGAVYRVRVAGAAFDSTVTVELEGALSGPVKLRSDQPWLVAPPSVQLSPPRTRLSLTLLPSQLPGPGVEVASVLGWSSDSTVGPLFRAVATVVTAYPRSDSTVVERTTLPAGGTQRLFFQADSARAFRVRLSAGAKGQQVLAFLHEPGGQPHRGQNGIPGGFGNEAAVYEVDGRDVVGGVYEAVAVAPPGGGTVATIEVAQAPVTISAGRARRDTVVARIANDRGAAAAGTVSLGLVGEERGLAFSQRGSAERRVPFRIPAWAKRLVVDLSLGRDQWPLFTDFGLTVVDAEGRILAKEPMNYAFGRLTAQVPPAAAGRDAVVVLTPGFADPDATALWDANLSIRLYAEAPVLVEPVGLAEFSLARGATAAFRFPLGKLPWPLGDAFAPLGQVVVESAGKLWSREVPLGEPTPPIMR